jgi:hypothetical protein
MIGFSPWGIIEATVIFPAMLVWALILDLIGVVLACFGLDDFFILDALGLLTIGLWILLRSGQFNRPEKKEVKEEGKAAQKGSSTAIKEGEEISLKAEAKSGRRAGARIFGRVAVRLGIITVLELIPYIDAVLFGWTLLVLMELVSDFNSFDLEYGD